MMDVLRSQLLCPPSLEAMSPAFRHKGRINGGPDADPALFDPTTVTDRATFEKANLPPEGIPFVVVNGTVVVDSGQVLRAAK